MKGKKLVIWGASLNGIYISEKLQSKGYDVVFFIDNNPKYEGKTINNIPVVGIDQIKDLISFDDICIILAVIKAHNYFQIIEQIKEYKIENMCIVKSGAKKIGLDIDLEMCEEEGQILWIIKNGKKYNIIPYLEINIIDNCNLNCKACSHFSSLFPNESIYSFENYKEELSQLRKVGKLLKLRLLGGEPFLVKDLANYFIYAREIFKEAEIEIATNGLLIPTMSDKFWKQVHDNKIIIDVSLYKPTENIKTKLEDILNQNKIMWWYTGEKIEEFSRNITLTRDNNSDISSRVCGSSSCTFLRNGNVYKCPVSGLIYKFMETYDFEFAYNEEYINIFDDPQKIYTKLMNLLLNPIDLCKFCSEKLDIISWETKHIPSMEDWLFQK